jgi:hypothetical protein
MRMVPVKAVKFCYWQVIAGFKTLKFLYDQAQRVPPMGCSNGAKANP